MAGKRRDYRPIWRRIRYLANVGRVVFPLRLWWKGTARYVELVEVDEEFMPRVHLPSEVQAEFRAIKWKPYEKRVTNWPEMDARVEAVRTALDGTHSPNTVATAVYGPLTNPDRASQNYNFNDEFTLDGPTLRLLFADLCSTGETVDAESAATVLLFRKSMIEPLSPSQKFRLTTPFGCFVMTRGDFDRVFDNVARSASYQKGQYSYPRPPEKLFQFEDLDKKVFSDEQRFSLRELIADTAVGSLVEDEESEDSLDDDTQEDGAVAASVDTRYEARNVILFGPPGTGKSFRLQQSHLQSIGIPLDDPKRIFRTTFHPELSYHDFVGTYKPMRGMERSTDEAVDAAGKRFLSNGENAKPLIYYGYEPGPLIDAYVAAVRDATRNYALVIEELNRGNTAAIFGDFFQLLDRGAGHVSQYPIKPAGSLRSFLLEQGVTDCDELRLPSNLFLYATMNTSDQSLFPMDAAFKRRWVMEYVGISFDEPSLRTLRVPIADDVLRPWWAVATVVNQRIVAATGVDDKQLGPYFLREEASGVVSSSTFRSKVLFFLWADVFRGQAGALFHSDVSTYDELVRRHRDRRPVFSDEVVSAIDLLILSELA